MKGGYNIQSKLFLVLCLHRSGSSATAGVLHHLEIHMGQNLVKENKGNIKGHFENIEFILLNNKLLNELGGSWKSPPLPKEIRKIYIPHKRVSNFLFHHVRPVWGIKDPRMIITFDFWKKHLERVSDVTYIFVHRPFEESVLSLAHRDHITREKAQTILLPYLKNKDRIRKMLLEEQADIIDVHFHELLNDPQSFVSEVNKRLGNKPDYRLDSVIKFLDKSLKNF